MRNILGFSVSYIRYLTVTYQSYKGFCYSLCHITEGHPLLRHRIWGLRQINSIKTRILPRRCIGPIKRRKHICGSIGFITPSSILWKHSPVISDSRCPGSINSGPSPRHGIIPWNLKELRKTLCSLY